MPLVVAPVNTLLKVVKILVDEKTKRHLENLGILVNSNLTIISKNDGAIIIKVKDGRLLLRFLLPYKQDRLRPQLEELILNRYSFLLIYLS